MQISSSRHTANRSAASAMYGNQFYNIQLAARDNGWTPFSAMENHYNMLYREDERELIPICKQMGASLMPYSPLAAGHLTRPTWEADILRARTDRVARGKYDRMEQEDIEIQRACHYDDVRRLHGVQNFAHVVVQGALSAVVAAVVAGVAGGNLFAADKDLLNLVAALLRTAQELVAQQIRVAALAGAAG